MDQNSNESIQTVGEWMDSLIRVIIQNKELDMLQLQNENMEVILDYAQYDSINHVTLEISMVAKPEADMGGRIVASSAISFDTMRRKVYLMDSSSGEFFERE